MALLQTWRRLLVQRFHLRWQASPEIREDQKQDGSQEAEAAP